MPLFSSFSSARRPCTWPPRRAHTEAITQLLEAGADTHATDEFGQTALHEAATWGHAAAITRLLKAGADIHATFNNQHPSSPHWKPSDSVPDRLAPSPPRGATRQPSRKLLEAGADIHATDERGRTALHRAVEKMAAKNSKRLLEKAEANDDAFSKDFYTKGYSAAIRRHTATITSLLAAGANANATDKNGWTALHLAVKGGLRGSHHATPGGRGQCQRQG